ncbi:hypothetical protein [Aliikangiella maris]|uniref:Uncharacterized protein n=2 Tax=Aliikangiella maris TaxID=3162458 RepID=A0ABV3MJA8_9GAMM
MFCPKCKNKSLKPTKLDDGLSAAGCLHCHGALVSLLYYRDWAERHNGIITEAPSTVGLLKGMQSEDSMGAVGCPKCNRLMQKYRISGCTNNRLDWCTTCDEVWLDGGEWELIKALELGQEIPMVLTEQWQKKVRAQVSEENRRERFAKILTAADLQKADEFRDWLKDHAQKEDILFYVNHQ